MALFYVEQARKRPTARGGDEGQAEVWGLPPPRAFSLEETSPPLVPGPKDQGLAAGFSTVAC
jgi:hypothetical protein